MNCFVLYMICMRTKQILLIFLAGFALAIIFVGAVFIMQHVINSNAKEDPITNTAGKELQDSNAKDDHLENVDTVQRNTVAVDKAHKKTHEFVTWNNRALDFTVDVPSEWAITKENIGTLIGHTAASPDFRDGAAAVHFGDRAVLSGAKFRITRVDNLGKSIQDPQKFIDFQMSFADDISNISSSKIIQFGGRPAIMQEGVSVINGKNSGGFTTIRTTQYGQEFTVMFSYNSLTQELQDVLNRFINSFRFVQYSMQRVGFATSFYMQIPSEWTFGPSQVHGGAAETTDVFDENGRLVMRILWMSIPRGFGGVSNLSFNKDAPVRSQIGDIEKYTIYDTKTGGGQIIHTYGFMEDGFEITVPFGSRPLVRNAGEYERGEGVPLRYSSLADVQKDGELIDRLVQSISK